MRKFQNKFETRKRSFISAFLICMTEPLTHTFFYGTTPVAATDYVELYNLVSNSNRTSFVKDNYPNFILAYS